jgi:hypothetical protein
MLFTTTILEPVLKIIIIIIIIIETFILKRRGNGVGKQQTELAEREGPLDGPSHTSNHLYVKRILVVSSPMIINILNNIVKLLKILL